MQANATRQLSLSTLVSSTRDLGLMLFSGWTEVRRRRVPGFSFVCFSVRFRPVSLTFKPGPVCVSSPPLCSPRSALTARR